jgi:hypothetical protein
MGIYMLLREKMMNMNIQPPGLEARLSAQERRQLHADARIEEIGAEMSESFKQLALHIDTTMASKEDLAAMEMRNQIALTAMETRILDAFKQLLTTISPPPEDGK